MYKSTLTNREKQIAELIACGHSADYISKNLFIEKCTVKSHIHNIYAKYALIEKIKGNNDPSKRIKFVNLWNKEKYGDIDLILSQNREVLNQNKSLQNERMCLMNVILNAVKNCNICKYSKNNDNCAEYDLKNALLKYTNFGGFNNG